MAPLFDIAIRKAVEKGLEEDRRDLEEREYESDRINRRLAGCRFCGDANFSDIVSYERRIARLARSAPK